MLGDVRIDKEGTMRKLREKGITRVELSFSGGNDEGECWIDQVLGTDGQVLDQDAVLGSRVYVGYTFRNGQWVEAQEFSDEQKEINDLHDQLTAPVYNKYGSFAGEFEAHGSVTWDVEKNEVEFIDNIMDTYRSESETF